MEQEVIKKGLIHLFVWTTAQAEDAEPAVEIRFGFTNLQLPERDKTVAIRLNSEVTIEIKPISLGAHRELLIASVVLEPRAYRLLLSEVETEVKACDDEGRHFYLLPRKFDLRHTMQ